MAWPPFAAGRPLPLGVRGAALRPEGSVSGPGRRVLCCLITHTRLSLVPFPACAPWGRPVALLSLAPRWLLWVQGPALGPAGNGDQCPGTSEVQIAVTIELTTRPSPGSGSVTEEEEEAGMSGCGAALRVSLGVSQPGSGVRMVSSPWCAEGSPTWGSVTGASPRGAASLRADHAAARGPVLGSCFASGGHVWADTWFPGSRPLPARGRCESPARACES